MRKTSTFSIGIRKGKATSLFSELPKIHVMIFSSCIQCLSKLNQPTNGPTNQQACRLNITHSQHSCFHNLTYWCKISENSIQMPALAWHVWPCLPRSPESAKHSSPSAPQSIARWGVKRAAHSWRGCARTRESSPTCRPSNKKGSAFQSNPSV